jgi:hypothetical protein
MEKIQDKWNVDNALSPGSDGLSATQFIESTGSEKFLSLLDSFLEY